ncbi:hypothetical protein Tco_1402365 [Tanacetum coccineum]
MLAPRSAKALQEKVLLKLHGIRKLLGSPSLGGTLFWIILGIPAKMSIRGLRLHHRSEVDMFSLSFADPFGINGLVECYLKKTPEVAPIACHKSIELILKIMIEADDFWLRF